MATGHVHGSPVRLCKPWCFFLDVIRRKSLCISFLSSIKLNPEHYTCCSQHLAGQLSAPISPPTALPKGATQGGCAAPSFSVSGHHSVFTW